LITNKKIPLQVIKNTCDNFLQVFYTLKYCGISSREYDLSEIVDSIKSRLSYVCAKDIKVFVDYLKINGWSKELKDDFICNKIIDKTEFTRYNSKIKLVIESIECGLEGCKDILKDIFKKFLDGGKYYHRGISISDSTLLDIDEKHLKIIKKELPDIFEQISKRISIASCRKDIRDITPTGRISGAGLFIANAERYMKSKGRRGILITPQEYYDDFFETMSTEYWNSGDETDRIALYMMIALIKLNKINEIEQMKIYWTYDFTESVVKYILSKAEHNSFVGELGAIKQDYSQFAETFLLTEQEGEQFLNYLLQNIKNEKMYYNVSNTKFADDILERHRIFSLAYYIKGWGFDRYYKLVEIHKYQGENNVKYKDNYGGTLFKTDRYRLEYLKDIFDYLSYKRLKEEFDDLYQKVMSWTFTKDEERYTNSILSDYKKEVSRTSRY
jgi:hypothetical protein